MMVISSDDDGDGVSEFEGQGFIKYISYNCCYA